MRGTQRYRFDAPATTVRYYVASDDAQPMMLALSLRALTAGKQMGFDGRGGFIHAVELQKQNLSVALVIFSNSRDPEDRHRISTGIRQRRSDNVYIRQYSTHMIEDCTAVWP